MVEDVDLALTRRIRVKPPVCCLTLAYSSENENDDDWSIESSSVAEYYC